MDSKKDTNRKNIYFKSNTLDYVKAYQKENNLSSFSNAIDNIILEHKKNTNTKSKELEMNCDALAQKISNNIKSELLKSLTININTKEK